MSRFVAFSLIFTSLFVSCAQQAQPVFYKNLTTANKSVAVPISSSSIGVNGFGYSMTDSPFLLALKDELRAIGWKIIVQGVTGRAGETNSINSGATYTIISAERAPLSFVSAGLIGQAQGGEINLVLVENSTGEEIMVIRGKVYNAKKLAKQVVQQIQQHSM